jgi:hypothetical protein
VKSRIIWICAVSITSTFACSFERTPVGKDEALADAKRLWASDLGSDAVGSLARSGAKSDQQDQGPEKAQTGTREDDPKPAAKDAGAGDNNENSENDEDAGREPEQKPTQCGDQACPLLEDQVGACCTTQSDVDQHGANATGVCGINLSQVDEAQYGQGCWQRDQLGIIDPRCPARGSEPGCCADDGLCGTSDPARHLGCYHAKDSVPRPCRQEAEPVGTVCDPRGYYALRISVDSAWNGRPGGLAALTDDGRGKIQIYLLVRVDDVDAASGELKPSVRVCGVNLPQFYSSTLCESYQALFPETIWESASLPAPNVSGKYECAADGCVMSLWPSTYLFGMRMESSEDAWPTAQQTRYLRCPDLPGENCFADDDGDGNPGISIRVQTQGDAPVVGACGAYPFRGAPLNDSIGAIFGGVRRADRLHVGIRARVGGSVRFGGDCVSAAGSAVVEYVNSRADGCYVQPGTFDLGSIQGPAGDEDRCREQEASFIDLSMPVYQVLGAGESPAASRMPRDNSPSEGPTVRVVRFPVETVPGCAEARQAVF